jgi:hypothetical protein
VKLHFLAVCKFRALLELAVQVPVLPSSALQTLDRLFGPLLSLFAASNVIFGQLCIFAYFYQIAIMIFCANTVC